MDNTLLASNMSLVSALVGAIIGGVLSFMGSKSATRENIKEQREVSERLKNEEIINYKKGIANNCEVIYVDFVSAVWESLMIVKEIDENELIPMIPVNKNYAFNVGYVSRKFHTAELIRINKFYGMIEKIRSDFENYDYEKSSREVVKTSIKVLLHQLYKEKLTEVFEYDFRMFTIDLALNNLSTDYKLLFQKLKKLSSPNNIEIDEEDYGVNRNYK